MSAFGARINLLTVTVCTTHKAPVVLNAAVCFSCSYRTASMALFISPSYLPAYNGWQRSILITLLPRLLLVPTKTIFNSLSELIKTCLHRLAEQGHHSSWDNRISKKQQSKSGLGSRNRRVFPAADALQLLASVSEGTDWTAREWAIKVEQQKRRTAGKEPSGEEGGREDLDRERKEN